MICNPFDTILMTFTKKKIKNKTKLASCSFLVQEGKSYSISLGTEGRKSRYTILANVTFIQRVSLDSLSSLIKYTWPVLWGSDTTNILWKNPILCSPVPLSKQTENSVHCLILSLNAINWWQIKIPVKTIMASFFSVNRDF